MIQNKNGKFVDPKELKTVRGHRLEEDGTITAIRTDIFKNGQEREVTNVNEEKGIDLETVNRVLDENVPKAIEKMDKEIAKLGDEIVALLEETKDHVNTREFLKFKKYVESEEYKNMAAIFEKVREMNQKKAQLEYAELERDDHLGWKKQFLEMKETLSKS